MSVYNSSIPQPTDRPSASQDQLLNNFGALKVFLDRNHVAIVDPTTNTGEGKHKFLQMPEQAAAPTTAVNEGGLYVKETNSRATLFYRQENNGTEIQLTRMDPVLSASPGQTFLPGGLILKWGIQAFAGADNVAITFGGTAYTTIYQVTAVLSHATTYADRIMSVSNVSTTGFTARANTTTPATISVRWMAIGV